MLICCQPPAPSLTAILATPIPHITRIVLSRTFFAYHLTHYFGQFSHSSYHTNSTNATEGDFVYVVSGDDSTEGGKDYALEGLFKIYRRINGPFQLVNLRGQPTNFQYKLTMTPLRVPDHPIPLAKADWYDRKEVRRFFSSGQNFNPLPTQPDYKSRFETLLSGHGQSQAFEIVDDLANIERTQHNATQREALTQARIGQGRFREDITRLWGKGEVCALTGIALPELLIASHIKPWRDSTDTERLDPANGLLLATHVDKLFDRYLLSFESQRGEMRAVIAPRAQAVASKLGIFPGAPLTASMMTPSVMRRFEQYMSEHLTTFLRKKAESTVSR
jgi:hypothetical protein